MWCDAMWCDVMLCYVMWCDAMLCYVMWCDVICLLPVFVVGPPRVVFGAPGVVFRARGVHFGGQKGSFYGPGWICAPIWYFFKTKNEFIRRCHPKNDDFWVIYGPLFGVFFDDFLSADILWKKRVFSKSDVLLKREAHFWRSGAVWEGPRVSRNQQKSIKSVAKNDARKVLKKQEKHKKLKKWDLNNVLCFMG